MVEFYFQNPFVSGIAVGTVAGSGSIPATALVSTGTSGSGPPPAAPKPHIALSEEAQKITGAILFNMLP
jgi:hypothetical protein